MAHRNGSESSESRIKQSLDRLAEILRQRPGRIPDFCERIENDAIGNITPGYRLTGVDRVRIGENGQDAQAGPDSPIPEE